MLQLAIRIFANFQKLGKPFKDETKFYQKLRRIAKFDKISSDCNEEKVNENSI